MSIPVNVTLDVRNFPSNGSDGYTNTTASNNTIYSYRYGGGSDGAGDVEETIGGGAAAITVTMASDPRYLISDVVFSEDTESQLSWTASSPTVAVITDLDDIVEEAEYSITVRDTSANCTFPCDPRITNRPA